VTLALLVESLATWRRDAGRRAWSPSREELTVEDRRLSSVDT
jgi:hypothetical protein